jgi:hypothetical protein
VDLGYRILVFLSKRIYIVEFTVEYTDSFSKDEIKFAKGPRR